MRFGAIGMKRPEHFLKRFRLYRSQSETSSRGRERNDTPEAIAECRCILSEAKQEERLRYAQFGVKVTHTIFHEGKPIAQENDTFVLLDEDAETDLYRVQAVHDHGGMGIFTTYYCEERGDINGIQD